MQDATEEMGFVSTQELRAMEQSNATTQVVLKQNVVSANDNKSAEEKYVDL
jgi:hypothetical protein